MGSDKPSVLNTVQVLDLIFKDPSTLYKLSEFENLGKPVHEIISIYPKTAATGRDAGKTKFYLKSFVPFASGTEEVQVYVEDGKSAPEEIVRQLWVYKLLKQYDYKPDEIALEVGVQFGTEISEKAADIVVYTDNSKETPKIIVECKKPKRKDGIEQLKSYMNADLIGTLKERWIAAEVAKKLDYPIFMAVSERGGKDTSGDYEHVVDESGSLVEFPPGHPQEPAYVD
jgi:hypothetical protein